LNTVKTGGAGCVGIHDQDRMFSTYRLLQLRNSG